MMKSEKQFVQFLDWLDGVLPGEDVRTLERTYHSLADGEKQDWDGFKNLLEQIKAVSFSELPAELRESLVKSFQNPEKQPNFIKQIIATLSFDSRTQLGLAGVRSAAVQGQSQQLIYTTQQADITLNIEPDTKTLKIFGQVFWNEVYDASDWFVQFVSDAGTNRLAAIDEFGEFEFDAVQPGEYEIFFSSGSLEIVVPGVVLDPL